MFVIKSLNHDHHRPEEAPTFEAAIKLARRHTFEVVIERDGKTVGTWSPLYGTRVLDSNLAKLSN